MKIAFAIEHFDPRQGGAEQYAWGLARWLVAGGHELTVFTVRAAPEAGSFARVVTLRDPGGSRARRPLRVAETLREALRGESFDVVHGFNHMWPCDVLRLGGGVHVAFERYNAMSEPSALRRAIKKHLGCWLPRQRAQRENERRQFADPERRFIAVSQRVADDMVKHYPACAGRVHTIHNGVDTDRFSPDAIAPRRAGARAAAGLRDDEVALLFVSNNFRLKGLHDLIAAVPALRDRIAPGVRLLIAGRGKREGYLRLARQLGVEGRVHFLAREASMLDHYAAADVLVHPTYYDACANVPLEAMACGLPVVVSRTCGVNELMTDGEGARLVSMPCAPDELAAVIAAAAAPGFRAAARGLNRAFALRHGIAENYRKVLALYASLA